MSSPLAGAASPASALLLTLAMRRGEIARLLSIERWSAADVAQG